MGLLELKVAQASHTTEVSGSSTAIHCRSPCGMMVAIGWKVEGAADMVDTRCTLP